MNNYPIGILDSGLGGLTVLGEIVKELPGESFIYIGDSYNTPYGAKTEDEIYMLSKQLVEFLVKRKVKLIVIACNTITVTCLDKLRSEYNRIPIVGTVPVIKTAAEISVNKKIGILSTTRTARSDYQRHLIDTFAIGCSITNIGTDALVPLIEKGEIATPAVTAILQEVLLPFTNDGIDTLALGCTHFPYIREQIQHLLPGVTLLESGGAIARQVGRVLQKNNMVSSKKTDGDVVIYTTGTIPIAESLAERTLKKQSSVQQIPVHYEN